MQEIVQNIKNGDLCLKDMAVTCDDVDLILEEIFAH